MAVSVRGQTDTSKFSFTIDTAHTRTTQTNGHYLALATKVGEHGHCVILQPDSLMAYYRRELDAKDQQYYVLYNEYIRLKNALKRLSK